MIIKDFKYTDKYFDIVFMLDFKEVIRGYRYS